GGNRLVCRARRMHAFGDDNMFALWTHAYRIHLLEAHVANEPRGQHQGVVVLGLEHHGRAAIEEAEPAMDIFCLLEPSVRDAAHDTSDGDRSTVHLISLAAHFE